MKKCSNQHGEINDRMIRLMKDLNDIGFEKYVMDCVPYIDRWFIRIPNLGLSRIELGLLYDIMDPDMEVGFYPPLGFALNTNIFINGSYNKK